LHGWGEPLLNKDLFKMIRYAKSKKVSTNFNTNAMLLSENTDKILDSGMDAIAFSVSTVKNMNKEMFDDIQYLVKKKESRRLKKPKTFFNVVVMPENYEEMPKILYLARDTGVDAVNFERLFPTERYIPKRDEEVLFSEIKRIGRESRIKIYLPPKHSIPCRLIKYALFVRWNGDVAPCCYLADAYLGNIIKESLSKISNRIKAFRKNIRDHPICSKCIT
jgi:MoaA/NifB/PqqE/SkfB family radical SAM enzyme